MHESKSFNKHPANKTMYHALIESLIVDEDDIDQEVVDLIKHKKRPYDDEDRDQDRPARSDQGLKKRKSNDDSQPSKRPKSTDTEMPLNHGDNTENTDVQPDVEDVIKDDWFKKPSRPPTSDSEWIQGKLVDNEPTQTWFNDLENAKKPLLTFNELMSTLIDFSIFAMNHLKIRNLTKADLVGPVYNLLKGTKLIPLQESQGRLFVLVNFFFNNDLEYLRGGSTDRKYTTSTTKTKAAKYDVEGFEDMVPYLWSPLKKSRHDVYSTKTILSVTSVTIDEWYGYGHLKEIIMRKADPKLYKFMKGDFPRLHLNDIKDMLLLIAQNMLNNLNDNVIVHLVVGLRMYTRSIVIQSRVEDL
ncbi:hypothetical protein Tco_1401599 [Tanacetum coccineum]